MDFQVVFSIFDYFHYINGTENSRVVYEGEQVLNAGHIILCGVTERDVNKINVFGLCLQTTALQSPPHKIEGCFDVEENGHAKCRAQTFFCSCKAGNSGRCKHISAVLLLCTRTSLNKLELISQTDIGCAWSAQKNETHKKYQAVPINAMDCIKQPKMQFTVNISEDAHKTILLKFTEALPSSALSLHKVGRGRPKSVEENAGLRVDDPYTTIILDHACQSTIMMEFAAFEVDFVAGCCKNIFEANFLNSVDDILSNTNTSKHEWMFQRKFRVTGSRIYEIFTYKGRDWHTKSKNYFYPKIFTNKFVKHGLEQETIARSVFVEHTGLEIVECGVIVSQFNLWLGYFPDRITMKNNIHPEFLIEIKCPYAGASDSIGTVLNTLPYIEYKNNTFQVKERHKYYGQVQLGMSILNLKICKFIIFCSFDKSMAVIDVEHNYEFCKSLLFITKEKYYKYMLHNICK